MLVFTEVLADSGRRCYGEYCFGNNLESVDTFTKAKRLRMFIPRGHGGMTGPAGKGAKSSSTALQKDPIPRLAAIGAQGVER